ncbi:MAG: hypothetical protein AB1305_02875 [Candidatus Hadarchaeota archaeon]
MKHVRILTSVVLIAVAVAFAIYILWIKPKGEYSTGIVVYAIQPTPDNDYINENVTISFWLTAGKFTTIGDIQRGIIVNVSNRQKWMYLSNINTRGQTNYSLGQISSSDIVSMENAIGLGKNYGVKWELTVPCTSGGELLPGMVGVLKLWAYDLENNRYLSGWLNTPIFWDNSYFFDVSVSGTYGWIANTY